MSNNGVSASSESMEPCDQRFDHSSRAESCVVCIYSCVPLLAIGAGCVCWTGSARLVAVDLAMRKANLNLRR